MAINRREATKKAAYFMGGTISAPAILGVLNGCAPSAKPNWTPSFFTEEQALTVMELSEAIFPATDTLGAKDLGVPKFIESMVSTVYKEKDQKLFMDKLASFQEAIKSESGDAFHALETEKKNEIAKRENDAIAGKSFGRYNAEERPFFWMVKELTLLGVFTTEYGATQILQYQLVPAQWEACVPLSEAGEGRTYAV